MAKHATHHHHGRITTGGQGGNELQRRAGRLGRHARRQQPCVGRRQAAAHVGATTDGSAPPPRGAPQIDALQRRPVAERRWWRGSKVNAASAHLPSAAGHGRAADVSADTHRGGAGAQPKGV